MKHYTAATWRALLDKERDHRSALNEIQAKSKGDPETRSKETVKAARDWWKIVSEIMGECAEASRSGRLERDPPAELFRIMEWLAGYLAAGILPGPMHDVVRIGRPSIGPTERRHIAYATAYLQAAKRGDLDDKKPVKTVAHAYNVKRQTVERWGTLDVSDFTIPIHPTDLARRMRQAGAIYSWAGRGTEAILKRDKRQTK